MNNLFTVKLLQNLRNKKGGKGFTLIELLVVVIIIGVLAAVALPNLLGQVAKGRQSEAKNNLGAINRAQQAHRLEEGRFGVISGGNVNTALTPPVTLLPVLVTGDNYGYTDNLNVPTATDGGQSANAIPAFQDDILDYGAAVGQTASGGFTAIICENNEVAGTGGTAAITPTRTTAGEPSCTANSAPI